MNTNMSPDDACHGIEIVIEINLIIRVQIEPIIIIRTPEVCDRVSHAVKNLSPITVETVPEQIPALIPASLKMSMQRSTLITPNQPHQKNRFSSLDTFFIKLLAPISALIFLTMTVLTARSSQPIIKS